MRVTTICCMGADRIGGPVCSVIALKCPEIRVTVLDNKDVIDQWNSPNLPCEEPELDTVVKKVRNRNLFFSTDYSTTIKDSDLIFISVDSPIKMKGSGEGRTIDLNSIEQAARIIATHAESEKIVVEKSLAPVQAAEVVTRILNSVQHHDVRYSVLSNPEFFVEGSAVNDLLNPERILIGCQNNPSGRAAAGALATIYEHWVPSRNIIVLNTWSAELSKLSANAFLAQRISSINAIAEICEESDADIDEISNILGSRSGIGPKYLSASLGFGGFRKQLLSLIYICETLKMPEIAEYWQSVLDFNEHHKSRFIEKIETVLEPLENKIIAIWGFSYRKDTSDTKYSPAIELCQRLHSKRASLRIYDPKVPEAQIHKDLNVFDSQKCDSINIFKDVYKASETADAIILCTEWDEFAKLDFRRILDSMHKPAFFIEGKKLLNRLAMQNYGYQFHSVGLPTRDREREQK